MKKYLALSLAFLAATACALSACGPTAEEKALKKKYSAVYADISREMSELASAKTGIVATAMTQTEDTWHVSSTGAFLYFVSELYKNDAFVVSDKPVLFTCSYEAYDDEYSLAFRPVLDEENNKVLAEFYVETRTQGEMDYDYIYIDVDYDFATETLVAFDLYMCEWETADDVLRSLYRDGKLYKLEDVKDEAYATAKNKVSTEMAEFKTAMADAIDLKHDFTEEYTASMNALFAEK